MKSILIILLFLSISAKSQYIAKWGATHGKIDSIQNSIDGKSWKTIQTIPSGVNYALVTNIGYYRISSNNGIRSNKVFVYSVTPITIFNVVVVKNANYDILSWQGANESPGGKYIISTSVDGVNWTVKSIIPGKGSGNYTSIINF